MKRTLRAISVLILLGLNLVSCGYNSSSRRQSRSGLKFRAFVSNPVNPSQTGAIFPALDIVDASKDVLSPFGVSLAGTVPDAGMMAVSPKKDRTVVFSPSNNALAIVDNAQESAAASVELPGATESMFVWTDNTTAFVAVPNGAVAGQSAGVVERIDLPTAAKTATIPIPGAHYLVPSPDGSQILVISDTANAVTLLTPSLIGSGAPLTTISGSFDKPVGAVFDVSGSTAYVMNCGPQCGGLAASVSTIDMTQTPPVVRATIPVAAATTGLVSGSTLYVAGTPPAPTGTDCQATLCGVLTVISSGSLLTSVPITDGYHDRIAMGANSLFIGSRAPCTNVIASGSAPARGCLSIYNAGSGKVTTSTVNGYVTGIEPIPNRSAVYVCEGGKLTIYDTTTDQPQKTQVTIVGQAIDVKLVDF